MKLTTKQESEYEQHNHRHCTGEPRKQTKLMMQAVMSRRPAGFVRDFMIYIFRIRN